MTIDHLQSCEGICVHLNVGREVWLSTLTLVGQARLTDFRPTNEDHFEWAPRYPVILDERLLMALRPDGSRRLVADAAWLAELRPDSAAA